jgi:hypothetical protein
VLIPQLLKQEIRRAERNEKREQTAAQMEYLKNVVLKFIQCTGDEQEQLVPALATLLQFNADELQRVRRHLRAVSAATPLSVPVLILMFSTLNRF